MLRGLQSAQQEKQEGFGWPPCCFVLDLERHRIRKYPDSTVHTYPKKCLIQKFPLWRADSKVSTLESGFKSFRIRKSDSPDACGRKAYPKRKVYGFKSIRIRVDAASFSFSTEGLGTTIKDNLRFTLGIRPLWVISSATLHLPFVSNDVSVF